MRPGGVARSQAGGADAIAFDVVIVGAGHAGAQTAIALLQNNYEGSIAIIGEEPELPYERPPLSKDYLSGEKTFERILIRPPAFWADRGVELMTGTRIVSVDPVRKLVISEAGGEIGYRSLVWATGGHARRLSCPGAALEGVHSVRSRADVEAILRDLRQVTRVVIVGGGYIGLEAAAVLSKLGKVVTVLEAQERVLARVAGRSLSRFYEAEHQRHGVDLRLGAEMQEIVGSAGRASGVRLADGTIVDADMVIVGIGIAPATGPLLAAGAAGVSGVDVDEQCRTSLSDIYAVGDCAAHVSRFAGGERIRLESVQNANDMATTAARAIVGHAGGYDAVPWFWSNQFDLRLQTVGLSLGHDEEILRGYPAARSFSIIYRKKGRVVALDCVNATKDYVQGKALVERGAVFPADLLADSTRPLKTLIEERAAGNSPGAQPCPEGKGEN